MATQSLPQNTSPDNGQKSLDDVSSLLIQACQIAADYWRGQTDNERDNRLMSTPADQAESIAQQFDQLATDLISQNVSDGEIATALLTAHHLCKTFLAGKEPGFSKRQVYRAKQTFIKLLASKR